jgi:hypothetical protein
LSDKHLVALWAAIIIPVMMAFGGLAWQYGTIGARVASLEELRTEDMAIRQADEKTLADALLNAATAASQQSGTNQELRDGVRELRAAIAALNQAIAERRR